MTCFCLGVNRGMLSQDEGHSNMYKERAEAILKQTDESRGGSGVVRVECDSRPIQRPESHPRSEVEADLNREL